MTSGQDRMVQVDAEAQANYFVGQWEVRPGSCELVRDGKVVKLEPRVMSLLELFSRHPAEVLSRIDIEEQVWPGVVVGYDALTKSIGKLREALADTEKPSLYIQTIPKKGYRLIAAVSGERQDNNKHVTTEQTQQPAPKFKTHRITWLIAIVVSISIFSFLLYQTDEQQQSVIDKPLSLKPHLLVLPFKNLNNDPQQDYFSDGITDDLITVLSGYSGVDVISSRVAFQYSGRDADISTLVDEQGVRYIVEGSIRRTASKIRINVHMVDAKSGINLWAEQYNRPFTDLFDIQDEVRSKIISALSIRLNEAERRQEQNIYTENYRAYDAFLRGQNNLIKRASARDNLLARENFEQAVAIDPGFARAYSALAMVNADAYRHDWADNPDTSARIALKQADHALQLAPKSRYSSMAMGYVQFFVAGNHQQAAKMAERTLELDKKNADANMLLATIYAHAGEPEKAEAYVETSMRLADNQASIIYHIGALAHLHRGNNPAAYELLEKSLLTNPERLFGKIYMTITLVRMKRIEEARWYSEEILAIYPEFDAGKWASKQPYKNRDINIQLRKDLREAGLN